MKKKLVAALLAALSLTVVGTGTVFATDKTSAIEIQKEHVHGDGCKWIVDKPAWTERIEHPEEGHYETQKVLVKEAWDEEVRNPAKDVYELHYFCNGCKKDFGSDANGGYDAVMAHNREQMLAGNTACGGWHDGQVLVEEGYDIIHHEAVYEDKQVWIVDTPAWTETIEHPEEGHWECETDSETYSVSVVQSDNGTISVDKSEAKAGDKITVTATPNDGYLLKSVSMNGAVLEKDSNGQYSFVMPNADVTVFGEFIKAETDTDIPWIPIEPSEPVEPENPEIPWTDLEPSTPVEPETPDNGGDNQTETPDTETPQTPDNSKPETPNDQADANKEEVKTPVTETKKEGTAPKTGDTASALPVAGAGVTSLGIALATILKKRK